MDIHLRVNSRFRVRAELPRMRPLITIALLSLSCIFAANAHDWVFGGSCPSVEPVKGLSVDKFIGTWYVIQQHDTTAKCLTFEYKRVSETELKVTKNRQYSVLDSVGVNHTNSYTGELDIPLAQNQGFMRVKWPLNVFGKADYIVFDTDYDNYAAIYECQPLSTFFYRQNVAIMSRTPELDELFLERVHRRLFSLKLNISKEELDTIDHTDCTSRAEAQYNLGVDGDSIKSFFTNAVDQVTNAAKTVGTSFQGAVDYIVGGASSVVDNVRRVGTSAVSDAETLVGNLKDGQNDETVKKDTIRK